MESFEETVVNPNIQLSDIKSQLNKTPAKQEEPPLHEYEQQPRSNSTRAYTLLAFTAIIIALVVLLARI